MIQKEARKIPELPEVAVLARDLSAVAGRGRLSGVKFRTQNPFLSRIIPAAERIILRKLVGKHIRISSIGKYLIFRSGPDRLCLRLGMTGQFRQGIFLKKHDPHHFMSLKWGQLECAYFDFRRFSRLRLMPTKEPLALGGFNSGIGFVLSNLDEIGEDLIKLPGLRSTPRISWLLRHGHRTGIGNYLANEALGRLGLSPYEACGNSAEALSIFRMCQRLAVRSYKAGGTSFGIGYFRLDGKQGEFSRQLLFYGKKNVKRVLFRNRPVYSNFKDSSGLALNRS